MESPAADFVFLGGRVFTGTGWSNGLAVRGDRVVALGATATRDLLGPSTRRVDLAGGMALPGFHDAHTHLLGGALAEECLDTSGVRSPEELAARVAGWIEKRGAAGWIHGRGWDSDAFPGRRLPTRAHLDAVAPNTPVLLRRRDGHAALANSSALDAAGVGPGTPDPPGGRFLRDAEGRPTGLLLEEPAIDRVARLLPPPTQDDCERALARVLRRAASLGITSLQDDPSHDARLPAARAYAALYRRGELPARVCVWRRLGRPLASLRAEETELARLGVPAQHLRFGLLKGYLDGSLGSRTALLFSPYADAPDTAGVDLDPVDRLEPLAREAATAGYSVGLHAIGDRAVARALEILAGCPRTSGQALRVEHAELFRPQDVARVQAGDVVASVQPIHLASDAEILTERLGNARARWAFPLRSLLRSGAALAFGTDYPVEGLDPLPGLACAVARRPPNTAAAFVPEEALTLEEALHAYTRGSAAAAGLGPEFGRLEPGAFADVAVLDTDLGAIPPEEWARVRCVLTLRGGEVVHEG
ncbi:MAG: amidohydrolase [Planctomycetota bacterium]|nr:MAG: amidohydrolase [Planctomycetota bacterium]